jgi:hypothetical protein
VSKKDAPLRRTETATDEFHRFIVEHFDVVIVDAEQRVDDILDQNNDIVLNNLPGKSMTNTRKKREFEQK